MTLRSLANGWNRFFFEPRSMIPLCAFRIVFGTLLLVDALILAPQAGDLFGEHGVLPLATAKLVTQGARVDVLAWLPAGNGWLALFFAAYLLAIVCLLLGLFTRAASIAVWIGITSLHHRNGLIINSADDLLRILSFWMMFAPAGEALSLDRIRRGRPAVRELAPWAMRMMQLQVATTYLATWWLKTQGAHWIDGTALYYVSRIEEFHHFPVPYLFTHLWTIRLLTWGTLVVELALAVLVWIEELTIPVLIAGVLLHLGIEWSMILPLMEWVMIGSYVLFLPPPVVEKALAWIAARLPGRLAPAVR